MRLFSKRRTHDIEWGQYRPYEPWKELEKLKSVNWLNDQKEHDEDNGKIRVPEPDKAEARNDNPPKVFGKTYEWEDDWWEPR